MIIYGSRVHEKSVIVSVTCTIYMTHSYTARYSTRVTMTATATMQRHCMAGEFSTVTEVDTAPQFLLSTELMSSITIYRRAVSRQEMFQ